MKTIINIEPEDYIHIDHACSGEDLRAAIREKYPKDKYHIYIYDSVVTLPLGKDNPHTMIYAVDVMQIQLEGG